MPTHRADLLPGQFVRIRGAGMVRPELITRAEKGLAQSPTGNFVYVVDEQGLAQPRPVEVLN